MLNTQQMIHLENSTHLNTHCIEIMACNSVNMVEGKTVEMLIIFHSYVVSIAQVSELNTLIF